MGCVLYLCGLLGVHMYEYIIQCYWFVTEKCVNDYARMSEFAVYCVGNVYVVNISWSSSLVPHSATAPPLHCD